MIATARRRAAALPPLDHWRDHYWLRADEIRREWLEIGLSTAPADRSVTEEAIASIYARHRRRRPSFVWVPSPAAAAPLLEGLPTHATLRSWIADRRPPGDPPVASDIAAGLSRLRSAILATYAEPTPDWAPMQREKGKPWPVLPPARALAEGLPFPELLRQNILPPALGLHHPIRAAMPGFASRDHVPVCWYGNHDTAWIAHLDALRRLRLVARLGAFDAWEALARSGGWWWPGERRCVLVERPAVVTVDGPVVEYRDGWSV